ncbi:MAG: T9SS type A sorting domain-containing protein, partial [Chitinophagales bacterium]
STLDLPTNLLRGPQAIAGTITNLGGTTIESFDLNWRRGSQTFTQTIEGLQLQPFEEYVFEHEQLWQAEAGEQQFIVFLTNINGGDDGSLMNNSIVREVEVLNALSQRTVLYENFTNASCTICAVADPIFSGIVLSNPLIAAISYHVNFPGLDVMYQESPEDVDARLDYHQVLGSPFSVIEGGLLRDGTQFILSANVNAFRANDALVNLAVIERVVKEENGDYSKVVMDVYVTPNKDISSSNLRLQTVVAEREVLYEEPPGSNGLTDFYYVMRKMLPTSEGTSLPDLQALQTQKFTFEYEIADYIKNKEELRSIIFVENADSKEILQTLSPEKPLGENNTANLQKLGANFGYLTAALQHNYCLTAAEGQIEIELFGETEGLTLLWSNGETGNTVSNLEAGIHELQINTANGISDNYTFEVFASEGFAVAASSIPDTDAQGNGSASIEVTGGETPFTFEWNTGETTASIEGKEAGVYTVLITDALDCQQTVEVVIDSATDIEDLTQQPFLLYPNPATNQIQLDWKQAISTQVELSIFNTLGQKVNTFSVDATVGKSQMTLDISGFESGVYLLQWSANGKIWTERFYVLKKKKNTQ